jgi:putative glutathione S-transferase
MSVVRPYPKGEPGWRFDATYPNATPDHLFNSRFMHQIYFRDDPAYTGKYSVPLLWDKKTNRIVNNESAEMLRWLPRAFDSIIEDQKTKQLDFYSQDVKAQIDRRGLHHSFAPASTKLDSSRRKRNTRRMSFLCLLR